MLRAGDSIEVPRNAKSNPIAISIGHLNQEIPQVLDRINGLPSLERLISMEEETNKADLSFPEALKTGRQALSAGSQSFQEVELSGEDLAIILFTSGTTGSSKAVMLTHGNIAAIRR